MVIENIVDSHLFLSDTVDENCMKSVSIDRMYGIFTFSIVIDFD
jgi:hypothetical protein